MRFGLNTLEYLHNVDKIIMKGWLPSPTSEEEETPATDEEEETPATNDEEEETPSEERETAPKAEAGAKFRLYVYVGGVTHKELAEHAKNKTDVVLATEVITSHGFIKQLMPFLK